MLRNYFRVSFRLVILSVLVTMLLMLVRPQPALAAESCLQCLQSCDAECLALGLLRCPQICQQSCTQRGFCK